MPKTCKLCDEPITLSTNKGYSRHRKDFHAHMLRGPKRYKEKFEDELYTFTRDPRMNKAARAQLPIIGGA